MSSGCSIGLPPMPKSSNVLRRRAVDGESLFIALLFRYNLYNFGMSHPMEFGIWVVPSFLLTRRYSKLVKCCTDAWRAESVHQL